MKIIYVPIVLIFLNILFCSCVPSLVYSPSLNLPAKPLIEDEVQILGGVGYLPETRPDRTDPKMIVGGEASLRYGISNSVTAQIKGWKDISHSISEIRYGFSISALTVLNGSSDFRFGIFPTAAIVLAENDIEGGGGTIPFCLWYSKFYPLSFYSAFGPVIGIRDLTNNKNEWGWGLIFNIGASMTIEDHFTFNLELAAIKQVSEYDGYKSYFLCPSLNIGYIF
jgi:hypothetical protein